MEQTFFYHCSQELEAPAMGLVLKLILVKNLFSSEENYIKQRSRNVHILQFFVQFISFRYQKGYLRSLLPVIVILQAKRGSPFAFIIRPKDIFKQNRKLSFRYLLKAESKSAQVCCSLCSSVVTALWTLQGDEA